MTPDQARRLEQDLLVPEAEQAALRWMYLTVEGIDIGSEDDLERYLRTLDAFDKAAAGRESRYYSSSSALPSASVARPPGRPRAPMMLSGGSRCCTPGWTR